MSSQIWNIFISSLSLDFWILFMNMYMFLYNVLQENVSRGGSRTAATSKMELFVIILNGSQQLTNITKCSILDVAAVLDLSLDWCTTCIETVTVTCVSQVSTFSKSLSSLKLKKISWWFAVKTRKLFQHLENTYSNFHTNVLPFYCAAG